MLKKSFFLFSFSLFSLYLFGQDRLIFPDDWLGIWRGELVIRTGKGVVQQLPMRLDLLPSDTADVYHWLLVYEVGEEQDVRPYTLLPVDSASGHWLVDEHNGILLDGWVLDDVFVQYFAVNGSYIVLSLRWLSKNELLWQIVAGPEEVVRQSGGELREGEEVPSVLSLSVSHVQRALLKRSN